MSTFTETSVANARQARQLWEINAIPYDCRVSVYYQDEHEVFSFEWRPKMSNQADWPEIYEYFERHIPEFSQAFQWQFNLKTLQEAWETKKRTKSKRWGQGSGWGAIDGWLPSPWHVLEETLTLGSPKSKFQLQVLYRTYEAGDPHEFVQTLPRKELRHWILYGAGTLNLVGKRETRGVHAIIRLDNRTPSSLAWHYREHHRKPTFSFYMAPNDQGIVVRVRGFFASSDSLSIVYTWETLDGLEAMMHYATPGGIPERWVWEKG